MSVHGAYAQRYIRREAAVSAVINGAISLAFFLVVFGLEDPVEVWGMGNYAFDFLPQSFMIGLMASAIPGLLARKVIAAGRIVPMTTVPSIVLILRLSLRNALIAGLCGAGAASAILYAVGASHLDYWTAMLIKLPYGALLGAAVTATLLESLTDRTTRVN